MSGVRGESAEVKTDLHAEKDSTCGEYDRYHTLKPEDVVLDIGAHFGYFSEYCAKRCALVVAVEAHPENFTQLALRTFGMLNVRRHNLAAWNQNEVRELYEYPNHTGGNSLYKEGIPFVKTIPVRCVDIGPWVSEWGINPTFIKIDAESSEGEILESLIRCGFVVDMAMECHNVDLYWKCRHMCKAAGMKFLPETPHVGCCHAIKL